VQPTWAQLLVVCATVQMENGNCLDIPVSLILMGDKLKESYKKIIIKLNYLLHHNTGLHLGTPVFVTDDEKALCKALDEFIVYSSSKTRRLKLNCGFHLNQNTRSYYSDELQTETQIKHSNFNPKIHRIYLTSLKLYYLSVFAVKLILNHWKSEIQETEFVSNKNGNLVIQNIDIICCLRSYFLLQNIDFFITSE
jgi:hypothetical protein